MNLLPRPLPEAEVPQSFIFLNGWFSSVYGPIERAID